MAFITEIGLDLGMGGAKEFCNSVGIQIISQVAIKNGFSIGRMEGLSNSKQPLIITLSSLREFFVGYGAHDYGSPMENMSLDRFNKITPELMVIIYGAFTRLIQQVGEINSPTCIICGLPVETLSGDNTRATVENLKKWLKADHVWKGDDKEYHLSVEEVKITSQPAGAFFDFMLDMEGNVIPERTGTISKEIGIISIGMNTLELLVLREKNIVQRFTSGSITGVRRLLELVNDQRLYSLGELDNLLRSNRLDVTQILPLWEREIIGEIEKCWGKSWHRFSGVILVGGGAVLLKNTLPYFFNGKAIIPDDPVMAIARGLWKLGVYQSLSKKGKN